MASTLVTILVGMIITFMPNFSVPCSTLLSAIVPLSVYLSSTGQRNGPRGFLLSCCVYDIMCTEKIYMRWLHHGKYRHANDNDYRICEGAD
jgi:hypothetical protein